MSKTIKLTKDDGVTLANVEDLYLFKDNYKDVEASDFDRLKEQIKLGEHSPLLITTEGEVLGGNTRLRAYKELGKKTAKVVVVEIVNSSKGVYIVVDGKKSERIFDTVNQAKVELALSHNDEIGKTNELKLGELLTINKIDTELYSVNTKITPVEDILKRLSPDDDGEVESGELDTNNLTHDDDDLIDCPRCKFEIPITEEIIEKVKTILEERGE